MKYLVMECHPAYAVVLDESGRFLKVANRSYTVGQTVDNVIAAQERTVPARKWLTPLVAVACACVVFLGCWQTLFTAYGSVRIKINPDVQLTVNRMDRVIAAEGLNADGTVLLEGYSYQWKTVDQVSDELADRAVSMGYLSKGGTIYLDVDSTRTDWVTTVRDRLVTELDTHMHGDAISILPREANHGEDDDDWDDDWEDLLDPDDDDDAENDDFDDDPDDLEDDEDEREEDDGRDDDEDDDEDENDRDDDDD